MSGFWRHKRSRQLAIGIGAAVAAVVVISAFALVWRMTAPRRAAEQAPPPIEEAESTTESAEPSQTAIAALPTSSSAEPTRSTTSTTPATSPATPVTSGALIAYRLGPNLYVADENGKNPNAVALAPSGDFTLSPDGRTIAVVDGDSKQLVFLDIGTRTLVESGIVSGGRPVWMPDSSGVLLPTMADVNGATRIQRFSRQGGSPIAVAMGGIAAVSPDAGTTVVGPGPASSGDETSRIAIIRAGKTTVVKAPGLVTAVACSNEKVYVGTMGDQGAGVWTVPVTGGKPSPFLPVAQGSPYVMLGLSPDAASLAFATGGDDGYSRVSVIPSQGGTPVKLWVRRDDYLLQWSADSTWVYLIEGNAFQGESTSLYRVGRNGHGRRLLVQDAGL
jgi:hypothetical protein